MIQYKVSGMTCGGCARSVTNAVLKVDAGAKIDVDVASKQVAVRSAASDEEIARAIAAAGFGVERVPA